MLLNSKCIIYFWGYFGSNNLFGKAIILASLFLVGLNIDSDFLFSKMVGFMFARNLLSEKNKDLCAYMHVHTVVTLPSKTL